MKLFTWLGVAIAGCGSVLMLFSERLAGFLTDRVSGLQPGWFDQVHWYLLAGVLVTLGGGLMAQFGPTLARYGRQAQAAKEQADYILQEAGGPHHCP